MIVELTKLNTRYQFTNEGLQVGDEVQPLGEGRQDSDKWYLHELRIGEFKEFDLHIIGKIDDYVRTQKGYGHKDTYAAKKKLNNSHWYCLVS